MNGVLQIEMRRHGGKIVRIVVEVMAVGHLAGAAVAAAVVRNHAVALTEKEQHLVVPVIGGQRPSMAEHHRLTLAPVLVENFDAVLRFDKAHVTLPCRSFSCTASLMVTPLDLFARGTPRVSDLTTPDRRRRERESCRRPVLQRSPEPRSRIFGEPSDPTSASISPSYV